MDALQQMKGNRAWQAGFPACAHGHAMPDCKPRSRSPVSLPCGGCPCTPAQPRQKPPMMQEVQPEYLGNTPDPVAMGDRLEEFFLEEGGQIKGLPPGAGWTESPALAGERPQVLLATLPAPDPGEATVQVAALQVSPDDLIGDGTPEPVALRKTLIVGVLADSLIR